jgi:hypothetical protein
MDLFEKTTIAQVRQAGPILNTSARRPSKEAVGIE